MVGHISLFNYIYQTLFAETLSFCYEIFENQYSLNGIWIDLTKASGLTTTATSVEIEAACRCLCEGDRDCRGYSVKDRECTLHTDNMPVIRMELDSDLYWNKPCGECI